ncbi:MAG: cation transporter [Elusimicrobia bacterium]|nr:cation transporter [Elusimicrobiota bacterium]
MTKKKAAGISILSNAGLTAGKLVIGILSGSVAIIAEAAHSGMDLLASCIAYYAVAVSDKPADVDHRYGHGKYENLSGLAEALLIFLAAGWIIHEAIQKFLEPSPPGMVLLGTGVMFVSATANWLVSRMLFRVGKETESLALVADAWHLKTDVYTSAGVMTSLALYYAGTKLLPGANLLWLDPLAAIAVALLILKAAWNLSAEAMRDLLDESLPPQEEALIRDRLLELRPLLYSFKNLRTRKAGKTRFVDLEAMMPPDISVKTSHDIADAISAKLREAFPDAVVVVHVEPCEERCTEDCLQNCISKTAPAAAE